MLLNCGVAEESWESLGLQGDPTSQSKRKSVLSVHWKDWCWSWNSSTLATWCQVLTHWKRPWCWERLRAGGERDDRGWDGWMASLTSTWVEVRSGSWWWTGKPAVLQSIGSQRLQHSWVTELNWTWQWLVFPFLFCVYMLDIMCKSVETQVNNIYSWEMLYKKKWALFFFQAIGMKYRVSPVRSWAKFGFCLASVSSSFALCFGWGTTRFYFFPQWWCSTLSFQLFPNACTKKGEHMLSRSLHMLFPPVACYLVCFRLLVGTDRFSVVPVQPWSYTDPVCLGLRGILCPIPTSAGEPKSNFICWECFLPLC